MNSHTKNGSFLDYIQRASFLGCEQSEVLRVSSPQIPDRDVFPILKTIGIPDMFQGVSLGDLNFLAALGLAYRAAIEYLAKAGGDANLAR